ncbi:MAG: helix-turn-helix transcriptional regulator [Bacteroidales bacterium]
MVDHKKIFRVFNLISRLRAPFGATKISLARDFDVTERTIERYIVLLQDLGFDIEKKGNCFFIERIDRFQFKPEDLIIFSLEEAATIKDALMNSSLHGPLQKSLLTKLYALTDIDEISETIFRQNISKNISSIRKAIKDKEQVILKDYHSVSSNSCNDRLVEPIKFFSYYIYLLAYEVSTEQVKQFKIDRISGVEPTGYYWQFEGKHDQMQVDAFGMSGTDPIPVVLKLSDRAHRLMKEEFPDTALQIKTTCHGAQYEGHIFKFEGIGRFIMGLLNEIEIIDPPELKRYVEEKVRGWMDGE